LIVASDTNKIQIKLIVVFMPTTDNRLLKVFLCHAHADRDPVRALYTRLTTLALAGSAREDGVDA
jgi:hypothetical protein